MKIYAALLFILPLAPSVLRAQNRAIADELETLLASEQLSCAQAARFTLEAADAAIFIEPEEAFRYAQEREWLPAGSLPGSPVRLKGVALLVMRAFDLPGGVFYSLFKNPHYSYREMVYKKIILGRADPDQTVSGELFLQILGRTLALAGETGEAAVSAEAAVPVEAAVSGEAAAVLPVPESIAETGRAAEKTGARPEIADAQNAGITGFPHILFDADSSRLTEPEQDKLREIAGILAAMPGRGILITGHAALAGDLEERADISVRRAEAAADYLVQLGVRARDEISIRGLGGARPVADNATPEGRALNRRVEITIPE
jgi:outer membrane protein OmpA-like peptidoglycan-associated protein